jgi:hypothetical protein
VLSAILRDADDSGKFHHPCDYLAHLFLIPVSVSYPLDCGFVIRHWEMSSACCIPSHNGTSSYDLKPTVTAVDIEIQYKK